MKETEKGPAGPEKLKIENLSQLKTLLEKEFGEIYFSLFLRPFVRDLSGYKPPGSMFPDIEREKKLEKMALENTKVTPEIIDKLNKAIAHRAEIMENELEYAKQYRKNEDRIEDIIKDIQEIINLFKDKKFVMTKGATISVEASDED